MKRKLSLFLALTVVITTIFTLGMMGTGVNRAKAASSPIAGKKISMISDGSALSGTNTSGQPALVSSGNGAGNFYGSGTNSYKIANAAAYTGAVAWHTDIDASLATHVGFWLKNGTNQPYYLTGMYMFKTGAPSNFVSDLAPGSEVLYRTGALDSWTSVTWNENGSVPVKALDNGVVAGPASSGTYLKIDPGFEGFILISVEGFDGHPDSWDSIKDSVYYFRFFYTSNSASVTGSVYMDDFLLAGDFATGMSVENYYPCDRVKVLFNGDNNPGTGRGIAMMDVSATPNNYSSEKAFELKSGLSAAEVGAYSQPPSAPNIAGAQWYMFWIKNTSAVTFKFSSPWTQDNTGHRITIKEGMQFRAKSGSAWKPIQTDTGSDAVKINSTGFEFAFTWEVAPGFEGFIRIPAASLPDWNPTSYVNNEFSFYYHQDLTGSVFFDDFALIFENSGDTGMVSAQEYFGDYFGEEGGGTQGDFINIMAYAFLGMLCAAGVMVLVIKKAKVR